MKKFITSENRTLKLVNVLSYQMNLEEMESMEQFAVAIEKMQNYIKVKGTKQIGPLVQYQKLSKFEENKLVVDIIFLLQCESFIHNVESPYEMKSMIKIPNCMYCRYSGLENNLNYAYDKIKLEAFENDITLAEESYTVYVNSDEEENATIGTNKRQHLSGFALVGRL